MAITGISVGVTNAGSSSGGSVPGQGHLLIEVWNSDGSNQTIQAGPVDGQLSNTVNYPDGPGSSTQWVQIGTSDNAGLGQDILNLNNDYSINSSGIGYDVLSQNSNTFVYNLLSDAGLSSTDIGNAISSLEQSSGLGVTGASYDSTVANAAASVQVSGDPSDGGGSTVLLG